MDISVGEYKVVRKRPTFNLAILNRVKGFFVRVLTGILGLDGEDEL